MLNHLLPFSITWGVGTIGGTTLWALALYLGFSPVADRVMAACHRGLQALGSSANLEAEPQTYDETPLVALASLASVIPFLIMGGLAHYGLTVSLGGSWAVSTGLIAFMIGGIYELGRQASQAE